MAFLSNPYNDSSIPSKSLLYEMERASYRSPQEEYKANVPGWTQVMKTPTLTIFKSDSTGKSVFVVAIRGTADFTDFKAWLPTIWNGLEGTNRWAKDYGDLQEFQENYPPSNNTYYGVGHSLGGEILDQFIKKGMIRAGISYNPAIQTSDIRDGDLAQKNYRIYASGDPLFKIMGQFNHPSEVRESPSSIASFFTPGIYNYYKQHVLANPVFAGGAKTAEERRAYQREYYRRNKEMISDKAKEKRKPPQILYESPFADEEHTKEQAIAHAVLQMLKKQKEEQEERELKEQAAERVRREEKEKRAVILRERLNANRPEKKPLEDLTINSLKSMVFQIRKKYLKYDDEGEQVPLPKEVAEREQSLLKEIERRKKKKK